MNNEAINKFNIALSIGKCSICWVKKRENESLYCKECIERTKKLFCGFKSIIAVDKFDKTPIEFTNDLTDLFSRVCYYNRFCEILKYNDLNSCIEKHTKNNKNKYIFIFNLIFLFFNLYLILN